jgi:hypothetical protein
MHWWRFNRPLRPALSTPVVGVALLTTACGSPPRKTVTGPEAITRLDGYLADAVAAVPEPARITRTKAEAADGSGCSKSSFADNPSGQVVATVTYETSQLTPEVATQYLDALARLWEKKWGPVDRVPDHVGVQAGQDNYTLYGNYWPGTHSISVSANSGCIWVNGTPGPDDNP